MPDAEKAAQRPEWLSRTCPRCGSKPGWGCSDATGRQWQPTPHRERVLPPVDPDDLCPRCGATNGVCGCVIPPGKGNPA